MAKYHIRPDGEPGNCTAKPGNCKYGASEEQHYATKNEARESFEKLQEGTPLESFKKPRRSSANQNLTAEAIEKAARIDRALESNLEYDGPTPVWFSKLQEDYGNIFTGDKPKIIDVIDSPAGKMAVVWSRHVMKDNDRHMQNERGFNIREVSLRSMESGDMLGYVKSQFVDDESLKRSFGDDEWSGLKFMDEYRGGDYGTYVYGDEKNERGLTKRIHMFDEADTPEKIREIKERIWAKSLTKLGIETLIYDADGKPVYSWNMTAAHAPKDDEKLDADLKLIQDAAVKQYRDFKRDHGIPSIDFSKTENAVNGTGIGSALYVYAARMLGKENKVLKGSGLQSDSAQAVWARFEKNPKLPIGKMQKIYSTNVSEINIYSYLDFREKPKRKRLPKKPVTASKTTTKKTD